MHNVFIAQSDPYEVVGGIYLEQGFQSNVEVLLEIFPPTIFLARESE